MNRALALMTAGLVALLACDKPTDAKTDESTTSKNATTTGATTTATATTVATAVAAPPIADGDLATPADFEETAEKAISKANYKTELTTLETDIAKP